MLEGFQAGLVVDHRPAQARRLPQGLRRLRSGEGRALRQGGHRAPDGRRRASSAPAPRSRRRSAARRSTARWQTERRELRRLLLVVHRRQGREGRRPQPHRHLSPVRADLERDEAPRLQVRRPDHRLRLDAGRRHRQRPRARLLPPVPLTPGHDRIPTAAEGHRQRSRKARPPCDTHARSPSRNQPAAPAPDRRTSADSDRSGKPRALDLDHDPVSTPERMVNVGHVERDRRHLVRLHRFRSAPRGAEPRSHRLAADEFGIAGGVAAGHRQIRPFGLLAHCGLAVAARKDVDQLDVEIRSRFRSSRRAGAVTPAPRSSNLRSAVRPGSEHVGPRGGEPLITVHERRRQERRGISHIGYRMSGIAHVFVVGALRPIRRIERQLSIRVQVDVPLLLAGRRPRLRRCAIGSRRFRTSSPWRDGDPAHL